jgi:hypothetical protein
VPCESEMCCWHFKGHGTSIFRVKMYRMIMWFLYTGRCGPPRLAGEVGVSAWSESAGLLDCDEMEEQSS